VADHVSRGRHVCNAWCEGGLHCNVVWSTPKSSMETWVGRSIVKEGRSAVVIKIERASVELDPTRELFPPPSTHSEPWLWWWRWEEPAVR